MQARLFFGRSLVFGRFGEVLIHDLAAFSENTRNHDGASTERLLINHAEIADAETMESIEFINQWFDVAFVLGGQLDRLPQFFSGFGGRARR